MRVQSVRMQTVRIFVCLINNEIYFADAGLKSYSVFDEVAVCFVVIACANMVILFSALILIRVSSDKRLFSLEAKCCVLC